MISSRRFAKDERSAPRRLEVVIGLAVALGTIVAGSLFFAGIGLRPDIEEAVRSVPFLFKFAVTLGLAFAATGLLSRLARPGVPVRQWSYALAVPAVLLALAVITELAFTPASTWKPSLIGSNSRFCLTLIPLLAIGPLGMFHLGHAPRGSDTPGSRRSRGGPRRERDRSDLLRGELHHDAPLFVATWYPLAIAMVVLAGFAIGSRA